MAQITTGIRSILSSPAVYNTFQLLMGGTKARTRFVQHYVKPIKGQSVLDIGCGTGEILKFLPEVNYWGYDVSQRYIDAAKEQFGERGTFNCRLFTAAELERLPKFDIVLACGLLHHLEDKECRELMQLALSALRPGGRFVSNDPCYTKRQNPVSRFLVSKDRGQNVRTDEEYQTLAESVFVAAKGTAIHTLWIPYTRYVLEGGKD